MNKLERESFFRDHAKAKLTGDEEEAGRIHALLYPAQMFRHYLFVFSLFGAFVVDRFGDEPDRHELLHFMEGFREAIRRNGSRLRALRAEALTRVVYGETQLLVEIPQAEHTSYMWAVMRQLVDEGEAEEALDERLRDANRMAKEWITEMIDSPALSDLREASASAGEGENT
ncbi:hypothetical protein L0U85_13385 [Glycomyces sp. L485]|uniref:hypothetical protein n=1 Tax=Glycomyces sp. L485 TaxID=2909235 RepID=UPI001F4B15E9|nr:hypothetical protein [Glycomyces sp. L485]MCH7231838.1 hypothetical protein [Glycomyces sp. L485]